jgi:flagellar M-ring protein FliF
MATSPDAPLPQSPPAAGANAADAGERTLRDRIAQGLARLNSGQKIALIVGMAAIIAIIIGAMLYGSQSSYKVLFSNLSEKDGGAIISALEQMNVPYKFSESGGAILVPTDKVHQARLRLATQGLPKGGAVGFEMMENQKFGISQFLEQVNYQRALEGELARTIQTVAAVSMARVHLAIPKPSVFVREEQKPTASVMLQLHPGRQLEPQQIAGITHLVASSIPQLPVANIAIVDQNGTLLSQLKSPLGEAGLDPTQLKYIREVEASVIKRIQEIISPITGTENVRVQAAADIDFSQQEQTAESFKPNADPAAVAMRSQQNSEQAQGSPNPLGVPGALSNQPPVPATAPITTPAVPPTTGANNAPNAQGQISNAGITAQISSVGQPLSARKDSTINYEVDRTITHTKNQLGRVKRLSVAVLVNHKLDKDRSGKTAPRPLSEIEIKQLNELARDAMGFSQQRGDTLTVVNSPFSAAKEEIEPPFWKHPDFFDLLKELAKYALIAGVLLYIVLAVLRPLVRQMFPPGSELAGNKPVGGTLSTTDEAGEEEKTAEEEELNMAYATYERKLSKAKEIATSDPQAVANILKEWISPNG